MPTYKDLEFQRGTKAAELKAFMDSKKDVNGGYDMTSEDVATVNARKDELNSIGAKADIARSLEITEAEAVKAARLPAPSSDGQPVRAAAATGQSFKSIGDMFTTSPEFTANVANGEAKYKAVLSTRQVLGSAVQDLEAMKALMTTTTGFAPANNRGPIVVPFANRQPVIADLIPQDHTDNSVIRYMEFTTFVNGAAAVLEGGVKPQSSVAATERQVLMETIAALLPVTEQQLRTVPQLRSVIDNILVLMMQLAEETQLLYGSGTAPQLQGFLTKTGLQTYALGTAGLKENIADTFYAALTKVRTIGFAEPNGVIINPNDWQIVRLMKTTQGAYIWGNPDEAGAERLWGKPVIPTMAINAGTGLTGDFATWSHIDRGTDIVVEIGYVNDDFARNQKTIRAEEYVALEILRPTAFCQVTGLAYVAP